MPCEGEHSLTEQDVLKRIGISAGELETFFEKLNDFLDGLNSLEKQMFLHCLTFKSSEEAAAELGPDVKPKDLEALFKRYPLPGGLTCYCCDIFRRPSPPPSPPPPPAPPSPPKKE